MRKLEVRYNNDMNTLRFKEFTQVDYDMLLCVCYQMNGLGTKEIEINYETIMDLMQWDEAKGIKLFQEEVFRVSEKLAAVKGVFKNEERFRIFNLFQSFEGDIKRRTLKVQVSKDFMYILNDLQRDFTKIELKEYIQLDSKYAKTMYMQIKQRYKLNGHFWQPTIEEFKTVMDIPEKLKNKYVMDDIIKPTIDILRTCKGLSDLEVEVLKARRKGSPVMGYRFTWTPNGQIKGQTDIEDALSEMTKYKKEKEKPRKAAAKKNSFNRFPESPTTPKSKSEWATLEEQLLDN